MASDRKVACTGARGEVSVSRDTGAGDLGAVGPREVPYTIAAAPKAARIVPAHTPAEAVSHASVQHTKSSNAYTYTYAM